MEYVVQDFLPQTKTKKAACGMVPASEKSLLEVVQAKLLDNVPFEYTQTGLMKSKRGEDIEEKLQCMSFLTLFLNIIFS